MKAFKGLRDKVYKGEGGFTLIELLIVIIILGILAAVVAFNVAGFLGAGTEETAKTERSTIQTAIIAGMADTSMGSIASVFTITANTAPSTITITDAANGANTFTLDEYLQTSPHGSWAWNAAGVVTSGTYSGGGVTCDYLSTGNVTCPGTIDCDTSPDGHWCCCSG